MINRERIGFWEAFSLGVGGMIGGGIFAVLGLSIQLSKSAAPLAFFLAGLIALVTSYSYAKLSVRYPSEGGTIEFLVKAFGNGWFSGGLNLMLLSSYIVMISLYAYAFGSYGANVVNFGNPIITKHVLITFAIVVFTLINAMGAVISGKTEDALVGFKLSILLFVVGVSFGLVNSEKLSPATWAGPVSIVAGGMIIFLAYEGFELIANTGNDVEDTSILPKAFYSAVLLVIFVYIMVAIVAVGTLSYDDIVKSRDYALAVAAEPSLGKTGFWLITFAALASTSSAINATLYGTARASYMVAKYGELPKSVQRPIWRHAYEGLIAISIFSLIFANTASLESISTAGSGGFLLIFFFVNLAALKLRDRLKINPLIPFAGALLTFGALSVLVYRMALSNLNDLAIFGALVLFSFLLEAIYRNFTGRKIQSYIDERLKKREENLRNWKKWIGSFANSITDVFDDAEIYLVGSIARGELHKADDVDILVFTSNPPSEKEIKKLKRDLKRRAGLTELHSVDLHFEDKKLKELALKKEERYEAINTGSN